MRSAGSASMMILLLLFLFLHRVHCLPFFVHISTSSTAVTHPSVHSSVPYAIGTKYE